MKKEEVMKIVNSWKTKNKINMYTPYKYFKGLETKELIVKKLGEMNKFRHEKDISKIKFQTDKSIPKEKRKRSPYHKKFEDRFGISAAASLEVKSKVTGVPVEILKKVYDKGVAAWKTGHRPGATSTSWGNARVSSFLTLGCTAFSSDADLLWKVYKMRKSKKRQKFLSQEISCPKYKLQKYKSRKNFPTFIMML